MNERFRVTVQYFITGLLGLVISQIFGILLANGMFYPDERQGLSLRSLDFWEFVFLVSLALTFFRIGHGLVILETSSTCQPFKKLMQDKSWIAGLQIALLLGFLTFGILLLVTLPKRDALWGLETGYLVLFMFVLLAGWDIPTGIAYRRYWRSTFPASVPAGATQEDAELQLRKNRTITRAKDPVFRALTNWMIYDALCIFVVLSDLLVFDLSAAGHFKVASLLLIGICLLDYIPMNHKNLAKGVFNGQLYFA